MKLTSITAAMALLATARRGYSCSMELANQIVRDYELDYRTAHEIVNQFVKHSRHPKNPASDTKIEMLEAVAKEVDGRNLGMKEVSRMISQRYDALKEARARHLARIEKLEKARKPPYLRFERAFSQIEITVCKENLSTLITIKYIA